MSDQKIWLCVSTELVDSAHAVPFDVMYQGEVCRAFAIRFEGQVHAFLNRCTHVPMEMDLQPNQFFDDSGQWLMCSTHGAVYDPQTGGCMGGPCRGGLVRVLLSEHEGQVYWHTTHDLQQLWASSV